MVPWVHQSLIFCRQNSLRISEVRTASQFALLIFWSLLFFFICLCESAHIFFSQKNCHINSFWTGNILRETSELFSRHGAYPRFSFTWKCCTVGMTKRAGALSLRRCVPVRTHLKKTHRRGASGLGRRCRRRRTRPGWYFQCYIG